MMRWGDGGWGAGSWVAMSVMMLLFWALVIAVGAWLLRTYRAPRAAVASGAGHAETLLSERFARGEIDEAQFVRSRAILHGERPL